MRVIITGGHGFLGSRIAERVIADGLVDPCVGVTQLDELILVDVVEGRTVADRRVRSLRSDLTDVDELAELLGADEDTSVFHLASMVSAESELDWSRAIATNVGAMINLLEAARRVDTTPRITFASSLAVFGGGLVVDDVGDLTKQTPQSTYGITKAVGEMLINDASRKGFIDGRSARLPTVIVRPGKPNQAASSFFSGLFREPLAGQDCIVPVELDTTAVVIGATTAIDSLLKLHALPGEALGSDRALGLPGISISVREMVDVLRLVGGDEAVDHLIFDRDETIETVVNGWPTGWVDNRARALGLRGDTNLLDIVRDYINSI